MILDIIRLQVGERFYFYSLFCSRSTAVWVLVWPWSHCPRYFCRCLVLTSTLPSPWPRPSSGRCLLPEQQVGNRRSRTQLFMILREAEWGARWESFEEFWSFLNWVKWSLLRHNIIRSKRESIHPKNWFYNLGHIVAQCGGAIAGASVMLGFFGSVDTVLHQSLHEAVFGMEFLLTFMIVLTYLRVTQHYDSLMAATAVGVSYMAATISFRAAVNPAFALGQWSYI